MFASAEHRRHATRNREETHNLRMRLTVGCGSNIAPGWVKIDRSPNVDGLPSIKPSLPRAGFVSDSRMARCPRGIIRDDVTKGVPQSDGSADAIYTSHMLKHLYLLRLRLSRWNSTGCSGETTLCLSRCRTQNERLYHSSTGSIVGSRMLGSD